MTKASSPTGSPRWIMLNSDEGPQSGQTIMIKGKGQCKIMNARIVSNRDHLFYRIVAMDQEGAHYSTSMPLEVLQYTGWGWDDSPVPFELSIDRDESDWHVVDFDSQEEYDVQACSASAAVGIAISNYSGIGRQVIVHPVFTMSISPSGKRWIASIRRLINNGGRPLSDCFTHPASIISAMAPFKRMSRRDVIHFGQELEEIFEKYVPGGIKWPALGEGTMMCTICFKCLMECVCDD